MNAIKNNNGTAVATENATQVATAVVASKPDNKERKAVNIASDLIEPSNYNARKTFDADALGELAQSISVHGLIQPITVRRKGEKGEHYEIICGERRFRACRLLNLAEIPCIIREATDEQAYDLSISENLQREDVPPMEAAEAYKRLIDTKRYDIASLAMQYGKSEKHIYQMLKLCDLIKGIANLVSVGKLTASAGIVVSKYDKKIQEDMLNNRFGKDGTGEWCHISANVLEGKIRNCYTNNLDSYHFDKTKCLKCAHNSTNFDLFADGSSCGKCTNKKCLSDKLTAYLVDQAQAVALADPKLVFVGEQYSQDNEATQIIKKGGYEFKNVQTYNFTSYPTAPTAPKATDYKKPEDFDKAQEQYGKEQEKYTKRTAQLDELKEQGKIRVYAKIDNSNVKLYYKEVATKDTKTNAQLIADLTAKRERNSEIANEKTAEDLKEILRKEQIPQSAFTADEETAMYFFMLSALRRHNYKAVGLKDNDYYGLSDERKLKIAQSLTEEQKTVVRRDYLYSHLTSGANTVSSTKGGMMLAFSKQHLPEKTEAVVNARQEEYGKKNARLDERIAGLKEAEKRAKADAKGKKTAQSVEVEKSAKTAEKTVKNGADTTAPKSETTTPKVGKEQPQATPNADPTEAKPTAVVESKALSVIPKSQPTTATVAQAV